MFHCLSNILQIRHYQKKKTYHLMFTNNSSNNYYKSMKLKRKDVKKCAEQLKCKNNSLEKNENNKDNT